ncbi:sunset domain-containing protein [Bacillus toyonensis]|uniref:sunset domain-containing protein n=1 Tax=Bacillus toyonensis TaxID=155322 RepID=UPI0018CF54AC|nr:protein TolA [Bacillus toyonensis]MBG9608507.1 protein TolA [Bacillus toyonensis]MBG9845476.1 protein TolA [Bacillus toyonensis]MBG9850890.1 protein TolA [Bacillus toyonensis]MBG9871364.1 protein TolA [Bacillus toyonensis]MBG9889181.1 protein TolA [Bacillus toyonensis]
MNWRKIFGYRSKTGWKMFIASIFYILILFLILQAIIPNSIHPIIVNLSFFGFLLSLLALIIGLIKPQLVLPKIQIKTRKKVLFSYLYLALAFFLMGSAFLDVKPASKQTTQKVDTKVSTSADTKEDTKNKEETDRKAQEDADRKAQEDAQRKAQEDAQRKAQEDAQRKAQEDAQRKAQEDAQRKAQEDAQRKAQEDASQKKSAIVSSSSGNHGGSNGQPFQNNPSDDKESNTTCKGQIKGNANSKKYHVPGGQYYDSTKDNIVWFCSEADAQAAGYVKSKR